MPGLPLLQALAALFSTLTLLVALSPLAVTTPEAFTEALSDPLVRDSIKLSLLTATASSTAAVVLSIPVAYYISRRGGTLARLAVSSSLLILSLPPTALGLSILIAFKYTPLRLLDETLRITFTPKGVVLAQALDVAPLAVSLLTSTFAYIPSTIEDLARLHGAQGPLALARILLPAASPGILAAWTLTFARALGEFGATLVAGGGAPGYTATLPITMYSRLAVADVPGAAALMLLTVAIGAAATVAYVKLYTILEGRAKLLQ